MRHLTTALLVVGLGAAGLAAPTAYAAPPPPGNGGAATSADRFVGTTTKVPARTNVRRAYGQGPVRTVPGRTYSVVFKGRKGDVVRLSPVDGSGWHGWFRARGSRLVDARGRTVRTGVSGFARLPRKGSYRFRFTATTTRTQLVKQVRRSAKPGQGVTGRARRGHQYAVDLRVPEWRANKVTFGAGEIDRGVYRGKRLGDPEDLWIGDDLLLLPDQPLIRDGLRWTRHSARGGELLRVLLPAGAPARVRAAELGERLPRPDGRVHDLPSAGPGVVVLLQEYLHAGLPGRFVDLEISDPTGWDVLALGPEGWLEQGSGLVRAPNEGVATLILLRRPDASPTSTLRLSSLVVHDDEEVVVDGPRVKVPFSADGRRVLVPVRAGTGDTGPTQLVVDAVPAGAWSVTAGRLTSPRHPRGCNGCGENDRVWLEEVGTSESWFNLLSSERSWLLLTPLGGQHAGELSVGLVRRP